MIERIGITVLLIVVGFGAYAVGTRWQTRRAARTDAGDELLSTLRPGIPAVIYFWSEMCAPCKTVQKPALAELARDLGPDGVQIVAVNAMDRPDLANGWGVLGLPTTFIVDSTGQPRHVNHGVTRASQLKHQLESVN